MEEASLYPSKSEAIHSFVRPLVVLAFVCVVTVRRRRARAGCDMCIFATPQGVVKRGASPTCLRCCA